ncbi:MAG: signal peptide peptidase SppA [Bacteroidetes bacterium CG23_combo_of_CG06-09_8_20_14_all_32_9]|nr:MAG: signal peptide peptidase SppA [Bacteroidetes bacterium CG23_combo_of_CG06-09_8_20_14_all_32_9]
MKNFFKYMLATIVGIIVVNIIFFLIFLIIVAAFSGSDDKVKIEPFSVLHLKFDYPITERTSNNPFENINFGSFETKSNPGLNDILRNIRKAKEDPNIKGIFLDIPDLNAGIATIEEIREALLKFRSSGKFIIAYNDMFTQGSYYLSTVANKIYLNPQGIVEFKGLHSEIMFFKGTLEKLGVEPEIIRHGKFKSAVEPFILDKMSPENREQTLTYVGSIWNFLLKGISEQRNISVDSLNLYADSMRVRNANACVKLKFVDGLKYYDEIVDELKSSSGISANKELRLVEMKDYKKVPNIYKSGKKNKIAIIYAVGQINMGKGDDKDIGSDDFSETIRKARKDTTIKAVVLRVNSPGGSALASEVIWREIELTKKVKPVVVSMSDVAASGGYYISCPADIIVADHTTITGSIGVFGLLWNTQKFFNDKLGITIDGVQTNTNSEIGSIYRKITPGEKAVIQESVEQVYDVFLSHVSEGRKIEKANVDSIGQGRVWSGVNAKEIGLIDEFGGIETALDIAKKKAGITTNIRVVEMPERLPFFEQIIKDMKENTSTSYLQKELGTAYKYYKTLKNLTGLSGIQARMPYDVFLY